MTEISEASCHAGKADYPQPLARLPLRATQLGTQHHLKQQFLTALLGHCGSSSRSLVLPGQVIGAVKALHVKLVQSGRLEITVIKRGEIILQKMRS